MLQFNSTYFIWTIILLIIEILIALYLHDPIIRPYGGDFLVVILIYCFVKSFVKISNFKAAIGVLIFSYAVEILQYFKIVKILGLQHSNIANIIIGTSFAWADLLAYTLGIAFVLGVEQIKRSSNQQ
ncbi:MAG: DUF2809 domain-containing protein [Saprospiraceae bacterium]|nr:DUF2809 domain-containing protein [Saprospiraceae bacterium]